jgi:hypothetical protein
MGTGTLKGARTIEGQSSVAAAALNFETEKSAGAGPIGPTQRLDSLDALRAVALYGVLMVKACCRAP